MNWKISFHQIEPFIYDICIYLTFKYRDVKVKLYLEGGGGFEVTIGWRCVACWHPMRDMEKLSIISFLWFSRASLSSILIRSLTPSYLFSPPWVVVGADGDDLARVQQIQVLTTSTRTSLGTCTQKIEKEQTALISLIFIYEEMEWNTYLKKNTDILRKQNFNSVVVTTTTLQNFANASFWSLPPKSQ